MPTQVEDALASLAQTASNFLLTTSIGGSRIKLGVALREVQARANALAGAIDESKKTTYRGWALADERKQDDRR